MDLQLPENAVIVFSTVHLDEMVRTGNRDALGGMQSLVGREISEELDQNCRKTGRVVLHEFVDPHSRFEQHRTSVTGYEGFQEIIAEQLVRTFGADNLSELKATPEALMGYIAKVLKPVPEPIKSDLIRQAQETALSMGASIDDHLAEQMNIDQTRKAFGLTSERRKKIEQSEDPIEEAWNEIAKQFSGVTKDQFFGKVPYSFAEHLDFSQASLVASTHTILNLIGLYPDRGLKKREKVGNITSDGQHIGMASYCDLFITSDERTAMKAKAIYKYWQRDVGVVRIIPG